MIEIPTQKKLIHEIIEKETKKCMDKKTGANYIPGLMVLEIEEERDYLAEVLGSIPLKYFCEPQFRPVVDVIQAIGNLRRKKWFKDERK